MIRQPNEARELGLVKFNVVSIKIETNIKKANRISRNAVFSLPCKMPK